MDELIEKRCHLWQLCVRPVQIRRPGLLRLAEHQGQRTRRERGWRCGLGTRKRLTHRPAAGRGASQPAQQRRYTQTHTLWHTDLIKAQKYQLLTDANGNSWANALKPLMPLQWQHMMYGGHVCLITLVRYVLSMLPFLHDNQCVALHWFPYVDPWSFAIFGSNEIKTTLGRTHLLYTVIHGDCRWLSTR